MNKKKYKTRLGLKFTAVAGAALIAALCVFITLYEGLTWWVINGEEFDPYWEEECQTAIESFQDYVTEHEFTVDQAIRDSTWEKNYKTVFLYFSSSPVEYTDDSEQGRVAGTLLECADGTVYAYAFSSDTHYYNIGLTGSIAAAAVCFFLILLPYVYHIIHRITNLSREMEILSGGNLSYEIVSVGNDELSELGRNIEGMRVSVLEQMERENEAVLSNSRLITALSHDLRTPLTRLPGYLEILRLKQAGQSPEHQRYLDASIENAQRMKELSDEMFRHFQVKQSPAPTEGADRVSGNLLLSQLISELCFDLQASGFTAEPPVINGEFDLHIPTLDLKRIFDNLFSNMKKYADKSKAVCISVTCDAAYVTITLQNGIAEKAQAQSNGLGLPTIRNLVERNDGQAVFSTSEGIFSTVITLPVELPV